MRNAGNLYHPIAEDVCPAKKAGSQRCCYKFDTQPQIEQYLKSNRFEARRTFDAVLAVTLIGNAIDSFYTRNTKDFKHFGFRTLINPLD
jgi:hypothetical protein